MIKSYLVLEISIYQLIYKSSLWLFGLSITYIA